MFAVKWTPKWAPNEYEISINFETRFHLTGYHVFARIQKHDRSPSIENKQIQTNKLEYEQRINELKRIGKKNENLRASNLTVTATNTTICCKSTSDIIKWCVCMWCVCVCACAFIFLSLLYRFIFIHFFFLQCGEGQHSY